MLGAPTDTSSGMHETNDTETPSKKEAQEPLPATGPRLGIIGGGQLARMTAMAALKLGCHVVVLERSRSSPAATLASHSLVGDWNTPEALLELANQVDVISLENEFVDSGLLAGLEQAGHTVLPGSRTIGLVQDKYIQKQTLESAGLPVPRMRAVETLQVLHDTLADFGFPVVLKARRNGYDGKGNATIRSSADVDDAWKQLGGDKGNPLYVEEFCEFSAELATIITRSRNGESAAYPIVETVQKNHICHLVRAPAPVSQEIASRAAEIASRAVEAVDAIGSFGVEMFLTQNGEIVINELAPRVHNSGHYSDEACACSQFENHVRAVLGLPLGSTRMLTPAAVMVNLLGDRHATGHALGLQQALAIPNASVHLYGKTTASPGRKMGHITALGNSLEEAEGAATRCAAAIHFGNPSS